VLLAIGRVIHWTGTVHLADTSFEVASHPPYSLYSTLVTDSDTVERLSVVAVVKYERLW